LELKCAENLLELRLTDRGFAWGTVSQTEGRRCAKWWNLLELRLAD